METLKQLNNGDFCDIQQVCPIHVAAECGNVDCLRLLLQLGADLNVKDKSSSTPLHIAASVAMNEEFLRLLVENGASTGARDAWGRTPLHRAVIQSNVTSALFLLDQGCDPNIGDESDRVPLHCAASYGQLKLIRNILDRGGSINLKDRRGRSALYLAVVSRNPRSMRLLCERGADLDTPTRTGVNALTLAVAKGYLVGVRILISAGAALHGGCDPATTDAIPLHSALTQSARPGADPGAYLQVAITLVRACGEAYAPGLFRLAADTTRKLGPWREDCLRIVQLLLAAGCRPNPVDFTADNSLSQLQEALTRDFIRRPSLQLLSCRRIRLTLHHLHGNVLRGIGQMKQLPRLLRDLITLDDI